MSTKTSRDTVARHIVDGIRALDVIASLTGWTEGEIKQLADEMGYGLNVASRKFQQRAQAKPKPQGVVLANASERTAPRAEPQDYIGQAPQVRPATRDLIEEGHASSNMKVKRAAVKAQQALDQLAAILNHTRAAEAAKRREVEERRKAQAEVDRLAAELEAARARLRGPRAKAAKAATPSKRPPVGVDYRALDEWCQANGHPWRKTKGRPSNALIEQYEAAMRGVA
jgi:hypothetical protein